MLDRVLVECASGFRYAERPTALRWQGERLEVAAVEGEWRVQEGRRFLVRARDGRRFALVYDEDKDQWQVSPA